MASQDDKVGEGDVRVLILHGLQQVQHLQGIRRLDGICKVIGRERGGGQTEDGGLRALVPKQVCSNAFGCIQSDQYPTPWVVVPH